MPLPAASPASSLSQVQAGQLVTVQDFITFFEAIPEERWCEGFYDDDGRTCAMGHLLFSDTMEGSTTSLWAVMGGYSVAKVNDGKDPRYQQPTPRARVLAALRDRLTTSTS